MSIIFEDVDNSNLLKKTSFKFTNRFVRVSTDPSSTPYLPFPKDYKFAPCFLQKKFERIADQVLNFKVREDDIWILGYPKSGTTWTHSIALYLIKNLNLVNELSDIYDTPSIEIGAHFDEDLAKDEQSKKIISHLDSLMDRLDHAPSPRFIRSHLPPNLLPKELWTVSPKMIYITRNPKDVAISWYHMQRNESTQFTGTMEELLEMFLNNHSIFAPIHEHVLSFWEIRHLKNILFLTYEEVSADRFKATKLISTFLGCKYNDQQIMEIADLFSFKNMRENWQQPSETIFGDKKPDNDYKFVRKGKVAGYREEMSEEYIRKFDEWTAEKLKNSDFKFVV